MKEITLWIKYSEKNNEFERTFMSFKGKNQHPLIMIIKEYWDARTVNFARILFQTETRRRR